MTEKAKYDGGLKVFGKPIGMLKHLFDRYRNYLSWLQLPLLIYTAFMTTVAYYPKLFQGHVAEWLILGVVGFVLFAITAMYVDWKYIFPSERNFMYKGTPYFDEKFNELKKEIESLK